MAYEFKVVRRVEFSETDMAGIVHFANFFRYMETAEHAFIRALGCSVAPGGAGARIGWPRVHARCDYVHPLRFEDEVEIHLLVARKRSKALTYEFHFRKLIEPVPVDVARGSLTVVCVLLRPGAPMQATAIPRALADRIEVAPAGCFAHAPGRRS